MTVKHSVTIRGHRTSITLEDEFWSALRSIGERRNVPLAALVARIDATRKPDDNLSSAVRLFVLRDALERAGDTVSAKAAEPRQSSFSSD